MPDIKTRDTVKGTIKTLDKAAVAGERMKEAYVRTKEKAEHGVYSAESSPEEYAADRFSGGTETVTYGFEGRVEWCACFVSWCANECGYIENGIIPKFSGCVNGVQWFKDRGQWGDNSIEPTPSMIIFFDWDSPNGSSGPQDGQSDHVGIVEKCENGIVYTVEGNSSDSCRQRQYSVGYYEILGYGIPAY